MTDRREGGTDETAVKVRDGWVDGWMDGWMEG